ncbi:ABC transporter ATP-binding protein [Streptomyces mirabilis]|nr:ABC transporter ATP-binding protein [Streptomyces mirabilis]
MIRFEDVSVTYDGAVEPTVQGVDFEVPEGELVLLVGPSGVGKSTVLGAVSGLVPHFTGGTLRGRVTVAGRDTRTHKPRELADVVGTVGQDPLSHFVTDTVEDELAYGMESLGLAPAVMRRRVEETLDLLGLADLRDRPIATLSGGQQQRVAIGSVLTPTRASWSSTSPPRPWTRPPPRRSSPSCNASSTTSARPSSWPNTASNGSSSTPTRSPCSRPRAPRRRSAPRPRSWPSPRCTRRWWTWAGWPTGPRSPSRCATHGAGRVPAGTPLGTRPKPRTPQPRTRSRQPRGRRFHGRRFHGRRPRPRSRHSPSATAASRRSGASTSPPPPARSSR